MKFKGLTALITGSTYGIGKGIAIRFAEEGANIVVIGRNNERGIEVVKELKRKGVNAIFIQTELTDDSSVNKMVVQALEEFGTLDIVVNNAGIMVPGTVVETSLPEWEKIWNNNVTTSFLVSHHVLPHMIERKDGVIINVASEIALKGFKNRAAYSAAKAAIVGLTKSMAVDHSNIGIRVNCICPGTIETESFKESLSYNINPEKQRELFISRRVTPYLGTVDEVANAVLFLASPEMKYLTGTVLTIDGGATVK